MNDDITWLYISLLKREEVVETFVTYHGLRIAVISRINNKKAPIRQGMLRRSFVFERTRADTCIYMFHSKFGRVKVISSSDIRFANQKYELYRVLDELDETNVDSLVNIIGDL